MNISIQPIAESDFEELVSLFQEFAIFEKLPDKMTNSVSKMKAEKEYLKGFTARDENGNLTGYVTYFYAYYTWVGKSLYMDDLYVREKYRGNGIGSSLIKRVITVAETENCNRLRWQVSHWNQPAIKFYESLGAEINKTEMNCDLVFENNIK
ncbi:GNAT superfamily N-acetyltransferase [Dysgonomonas sp. PFB1-18]|uniref:GNAT family N-acetyltransferase n=1 Tax=unclassified Dysgonomonas TaxID=2630389 RepID=UPI002476F1CF|nr:MULTISPECIES: GNAT family N-acetyltransferase [unclassified Dysgonomonas]MDH6307879.1 GNAT superfamily N-acetyltransferase [Dysgonomonas sp. PF1-14]MDH6337797.1 GNAT superfamily N-acetyltransferase [Dysgonomonas sp. PF1-16]MDH6379021.1 GNAT superfamily N-acetyltransferase [Dysgonomonas sp. PFB1-18]MDH6396656.1 GNAT superfamily N-acetyltransferase [Dysgonomonas sp. PF1-23]